MIPFARNAAGNAEASLTHDESALIAALAAQIAGLLEELVASEGTDELFTRVGIGGTDSLHRDPAIARLLPDAYGDDPQASGDFRRLTERGLASRKVTNANLVIETIARDGGAIELTPAEAQAWLRTLSDIRLTIAARLGIERDGDTGATDSDGAVALHDVYDWLAFVTESLVETLESRTQT